MSFLRRVAGRTRRDRIRNTTIRKQLQQESVVEIVERKILKLFGHVTRMDNETETIMGEHSERKRGTGRSRLEW